MYTTSRPFVLLSALLEITSAANIFVSHYQGTITNLNLNTDGSTYTLTTNNTLTIGGQPSWLTWDSKSRTLYASDETSSGSASLWSVSAGTDGKLSLLGKSSAPLGSVHNTLYGNGYIALAH